MNKKMRKLNLDERELIEAVKANDEGKLTQIKSDKMMNFQRAAGAHIQGKAVSLENPILILFLCAASLQAGFLFSGAVGLQEALM